MAEYFLTDYRFRVCDNFWLRGLNNIVIVLCNLMTKNQEPIMALGKNLRRFTSQYISLRPFIREVSGISKYRPFWKHENDSLWRNTVDRN